MRALVIDADGRASFAIRLMLKAIGVGADCADTAKLGLELVRQHRYELVLVDLILPDMSGRQLIRRVREANPDCRILVLSRLDQPQARDAAMDAGADGFMTKPLDTAELIDRASALLGLGKVAPQRHAPTATLAPADCMLRPLAGTRYAWRNRPGR